MGICRSMPDNQHIGKICCKLVARVNDTDSIRVRARSHTWPRDVSSSSRAPRPPLPQNEVLKMYQELWFSEATAGVAGSNAYRSREAAIAKHAKQIVDVLSATASKDWFVSMVREVWHLAYHIAAVALLRCCGVAVADRLHHSYCRKRPMPARAVVAAARARSTRSVCGCVRV